jgi:hypothetical protein
VSFPGLINQVSQTPSNPAFSPASEVSMGLATTTQTLALVPCTSASGAQACSNISADNYASFYALNLRATQTDSSIQDDFSIKPNLHLTGGLRFQYARVPQDNTGHIRQAFDAETVLSPAQAECQTGNAAVCQILPVLAALVPTTLKSALNSNPFTVDPRVGFEWYRSGTGRTVLRGGLGKYTAPFPALLVDLTRSVFPSFLTVNGGVTTNFGNNVIGSSNGIAALNGESAVDTLATDSTNFSDNSLAVSLTYPNSNLKNSYALQTSLSLTQLLSGTSDCESACLLLSIGYVGTVGKELLELTTPYGGANRSYLNAYQVERTYGQFPGQPCCNNGLTSLVTGFPQRLSTGNNNVGATIISDGGTSKYNSLQTTLNWSIVPGMQWLTAFTWSHAIDNVSDVAPMAGAFALPQDSSNNPSERGSSNFDIRLRSSTEFSLSSSPFAGNHRSLKDWNISGIITLQSGQPYTVNTAIDVNEDGNTTDRLNSELYLCPVAPGCPAAPPRTKLSLDLPDGDTTMVLLAAPGHDGAIGRNTFQSWALYDVDGAFSKMFPLKQDGTSLALRAEAFNILNHPNFGIPDRILESPGFGRATGTVTPQRLIQLALRLRF